MAGQKEDDTYDPLPIDNLPINFKLPEIIPLKRKFVDEFLKQHAKVLRFLETWAKLHLRALVAHPMSPIETADTLIDEIGEVDLKNTADQILVDFNSPHINNIEKPIGYNDDPDFYRDDIDEISLLQSACDKKKVSFFKRFLKWRPKSEKKDRKEAKGDTKEGDNEELEEDDEKLKEAQFAELKQSFHVLIEEKVRKYRSDRDSRRVASGEQILAAEDLATEEARWILDMTNRLHICHMAFKILGYVRERCKEIFEIFSFSNLGKDVTFKGETSIIMQTRIAYLLTTKVLALLLVKDIEKIQKVSDTYKQCAESFHRNVHRELAKMDSVEKRVVTLMASNESVLKEIDSPDYTEENLKKSESQRNLLYATEDDNIDLGDHSLFGTKLSPEAESSNRQSGSSAGLFKPDIIANVPVTPEEPPNVRSDEDLACLVPVNGEPPEASEKVNQDLRFKPPKTSSGYSSGASLLTQQANALQETSPRGERPSHLNLPDPSIIRPRPKPGSKEGSTSPMQVSPAAPEKMQSDAD